jgi:hypothetical protein
MNQNGSHVREASWSARAAAPLSDWVSSYKVMEKESVNALLVMVPPTKK